LSYWDLVKAKSLGYKVSDEVIEEMKQASEGMEDDTPGSTG